MPPKDPSDPVTSLPEMSRIFLIGYRGSGKSTVGRHLADRLGWGFVDADELLESQAGQSIASIFKSEGEAGFRHRESRILERLAQYPQCVIATGGGVILRPGNRDILARQGFTVWLQAPAPILWERIQTDPTTQGRRPALTTGGYEEVVSLLQAREPHYRTVAHAVFDAHPSPETVASRILAEYLVRSSPQ